jgi:epsilon-lactone hydrolase
MDNRFPFEISTSQSKIGFRNWHQRHWSSFAAVLFNLALRVVKMLMPSPSIGATAYVAKVRAFAAKAERFAPSNPSRAQVEAFHIGETPAWWVRMPDASERKVLLYLHGGGYITGAALKSHGDLLWRLSSACDCTVLAIDYGLAPEYPYPTASDQVLDAWRFLLTKFPATSLAIAGDSAGGNLTLSVPLRIRDLGLLMPAALCALSPNTDLTGSGDSAKFNRDKDMLIPADAIQMIGELYAGSAALDDPYVSPVFGDFHDFPPTLLQAGSIEVFLDDSTRVAKKMQDAGVPVQLDIWKGMPHVWHLNAGLMSEARAAIDDIGRFVRGHLRG